MTWGISATPRVLVAVVSSTTVSDTLGRRCIANSCLEYRPYLVQAQRRYVEHVALTWIHMLDLRLAELKQDWNWF